MPYIVWCYLYYIISVVWREVVQEVGDPRFLQACWLIEWWPKTVNWPVQNTLTTPTGAASVVSGYTLSQVGTELSGTNAYQIKYPECNEYLQQLVIPPPPTHAAMATAKCYGIQQRLQPQAPAPMTQEERLVCGWQHFPSVDQGRS